MKLIGGGTSCVNENDVNNMSLGNTHITKITPMAMMILRIRLVSRALYSFIFGHSMISFAFNFRQMRIVVKANIEIKRISLVKNIKIIITS